MPFSDKLMKFWHQEHGAVTVDWVVMSAAVFGLGVASAAAVRTGTSDLGNDIGASLSGAAVATLGALDGVVQAFSPLYYSEEQMANYHDYYSAGNHSEQWLTDQYNFYMERSADQLASANPSSAAISIDAAYVYREALIEIGGTVPSGGTTVEDLHSQYGG